MNHPGRSRHAPGSRGLALRLIMAQFALFGTSGLTHQHPEVGGGHLALPGAAEASTTAPDRPRVTELRAP